MTVFCGNCGNNVQANERFCGKCGTPAPGAAPAAPPVSPPPPAAPPVPPPPAYGAPPPQPGYPPPAYGQPQGYGAPPYGQAPGPVPHGMPGGMPGGMMPDVPDYKWQSIVTTLCCCLIGGAVAWSHSAKVKPALQRGDYATAQAESAKTKTWLIWSIILGLILNAAYVALQIANQKGGF